MSEEKMYAVKNDEGKYWDFSANSGFWPSKIAYPTTAIKERAEQVVDEHGGHVVALVEEPKKVVLTKEQAEIVERAHSGKFPAASIAFYGDDDEEPLMNAYVNGYTVAREKKYLVFKELGGKQKNQQVAQAYRSFTFPNTITWSIEERKNMSTLSSGRLTESEIEQYGLQDCEKEEVTDDGIR